MHLSIDHIIYSTGLYMTHKRSLPNPSQGGKILQKAPLSIMEDGWVKWMKLSEMN